VTAPGTAVAGDTFTAKDFRARAATRGWHPEADEFGDYHLNPDVTEDLQAMTLHAAAVLVPVIDRPGQPSVLLTQRTMNLRTHSGQIAFPGGRIDPEDGTRRLRPFANAGGDRDRAGAYRDRRAAAGLYRRFGFPDFAGAVGGDAWFRGSAQSDEVDAVFEVPLSFLMDEANHGRGSRVVSGHVRNYFEMPYGDWYIWGVTAGIIRLMYERLYS
jgi:hypothetical protein